MTNQNKKLISIGEFARVHGLNPDKLRRIAKQGLLKTEKKSRFYYTTKTWFNDYINNYTFDGFLLNDFLKKEGLNKTDSRGKIISQKSWEIDIEEAFVKKWQTSFKKIDSNFQNMLERENALRGSKRKALPKTKAAYNFWILFVAIAASVALNASFWSVYLFPNETLKSISVIDQTFAVPSKAINKIASNIFLNNSPKISKLNREVVHNKKISKDILSEFVANNHDLLAKNNISLDVSREELLALSHTSKAEIITVLGVDSESYKDKKTVIDFVADSTINTFKKMAEKQKQASIILRNKLQVWINKIK